MTGNPTPPDGGTPKPYDADALIYYAAGVLRDRMQSEGFVAQSPLVVNALKRARARHSRKNIGNTANIVLEFLQSLSEGPVK